MAHTTFNIFLGELEPFIGSTEIGGEYTAYLPPDGHLVFLNQCRDAVQHFCVYTNKPNEVEVWFGDDATEEILLVIDVNEDHDFDIFRLSKVN